MKKLCIATILVPLMAVSLFAQGVRWLTQADDVEVFKGVTTANTNEWTALDPVPVTNDGSAIFTAQSTFDWIDDNWPVTNSFIVTNTLFGGVVTGFYDNLGYATIPLTGTAVEVSSDTNWNAF